MKANRLSLCFFLFVFLAICLMMETAQEARLERRVKALETRKPSTTIQRETYPVSVYIDGETFVRRTGLPGFAKVKQEEASNAVMRVRH